MSAGNQFLVLIVKNNEGYTAVFSSIELALEYVQKWFNLQEIPTCDNYCEQIPKGTYCSVDRIKVDRFAVDAKHESGVYHWLEH